MKPREEGGLLELLVQMVVMNGAVPVNGVNWVVKRG
jgi:hypothetical protein